MSWYFFVKVNLSHVLTSQSVIYFRGNEIQKLSCHVKAEVEETRKPLEKVCSQWAISVFMIRRRASVYTRNPSLVVFARSLPLSVIVTYLSHTYMQPYCIYDAVKPQVNLDCVIKSM